jgi:hypothetical protein
MAIPEDSKYVEDSCGYLVADELSTLLGKKQYGADSLIVTLTTLYDGKSEYSSGSVLRGKRELRDISLSCMFGSTTDWVRDNMSESVLTGGFLPRCTMVYRAPIEEGGRVYSIPKPLDPIVRDELAQSLVSLATGQFSNPDSTRITPSGSVVRPSEMTTTTFMHADTMREYEDWYADYKKFLVGMPDVKGSGYIARKPEHVLKLAMILALSEQLDRGGNLGPDDVFFIAPEHFRLAVKIVDNEQMALPGIWRELGMSDVAAVRRDILAWIAQSENGRTKKEIYQEFEGRFATEQQLIGQMQFLEETGLIEKYYPKNTVKKFLRYRACVQDSNYKSKRAMLNKVDQ